MLISLGSFFFLPARGKNGLVIIQGEQGIIGLYSLDSPRRVISVSGPLGSSRVEIGGGRVRMLSSPCPNQVCTKAGWIEQQGQMICCVPNQVLIRIVGDESKENESSLHLDGVTR